MSKMFESFEKDTHFALIVPSEIVWSSMIMSYCLPKDASFISKLIELEASSFVIKSKNDFLINKMDELNEKIQKFNHRYGFVMRNQASKDLLNSGPINEHGFLYYGEKNFVPFTLNIDNEHVLTLNEVSELSSVLTSFSGDINNYAFLLKKFSAKLKEVRHELELLGFGD